MNSAQPPITGLRERDSAGRFLRHVVVFAALISGSSLLAGGVPIFQAGFETGATCEWSLTVPVIAERCDGSDNDCNGLIDDGDVCAGDGAPCSDDGECQSGACKPVLDGSGSVCAASADHCVRQEGEVLEFTTDERACQDRNRVRACESGAWNLTPCTVDAPLCAAGSCEVCQADELRCLGPSGLETIAQCNATGEGWDVIATCDPFGFGGSPTFCFEGFPFCAAGTPSCEPDAIQGCAGELAFRRCGVSGQTPLDVIDCGPGKICADPGECVDAPFLILEQDPPFDIILGDVAVTALPGSTTAMIAYAEGGFAISDLELGLLDLETEVYAPLGLLGTGRSPSLSAANLSTDGVLGTWYADKPPDDRNQVYSRWLDADGGESEAEALVDDGRVPNGVVLGARTGAIVWDDGTASVLGRLLDPVNGSLDLTIGPRGILTPTAPRIAPHATGIIVTWTFDNQAIHAQCFDAAGTAALADPLVVASGGGQHFAPGVAGAAGQGAVIVWESVNTAILAQRIDSDCALAGSVIEVTTTTDDAKTVAMWASGEFVVVFEEGEIDAFGRGRKALLASKYSAGGVFESTTRVTPVGFAASGGLADATWGTDSFVVVWSSRGALMARRFD